MYLPNFKRLTRFGSGTRIYTFPPATTFQTNFANLVPRTVRLPGTNGGFNEFLGQAAPSEIGKISAAFYLIPTAGESTTQLLDDLLETADWGEQRLWIQPYNSTLRERWCNAYINNIEAPENAQKAPDKWLRVTVNWQSEDPFWYNLGTESPVYGEVIYGGVGVVYGGSPVVINASGLQTDTTITAGGTATTFARLTITVPAGQSAQNVTVQRIEDAIVRDEVKYTAILAPGNILAINSRDAGDVTLNGADAYNASFSAKHPDWFRIRPGSNTIRVKLNNASDQATVTLQYYERYR